MRGQAGVKLVDYFAFHPLLRLGGPRKVIRGSSALKPEGFEINADGDLCRQGGQIWVSNKSIKGASIFNCLSWSDGNVDIFGERDVLKSYIVGEYNFFPEAREIHIFYQKYKTRVAQ